MSTIFFVECYRISLGSLIFLAFTGDFFPIVGYNKIPTLVFMC